MQITDLTITLHCWDVPKTTYTDEAGGTRQVGVVTLQPDQGIEGHSFVGSAFQSADEIAGQILQRLTPPVMGRNPLDSGARWANLWRRDRRVAASAICAADEALADIASKVAGG